MAEADPAAVVHAWLAELALPPLRDGAAARLEDLYAALVAANRDVNLTRLTDRADFWYKHVADSLLALAVWPAPRETPLTVMDVGCGAGFPGLPLALALPAAQFTEVDSTRKKVDFVAGAIARLGLTNCTALAGRARELARLPAHHERYAVVLARAVADGATLVRECRHLLARAGGVLLAYKTPEAIAAEQELLAREAAKAGLVVSLSPVFTLPGDAGRRQLCRVQRPG